MADAFCNRALCYINLQDSCNYCKDIDLASDFGDNEAKELYRKSCVRYDTIRSTADSIREEFPGYSYTLITWKKCALKPVLKYYDINQKEIESVFEK